MSAGERQIVCRQCRETIAFDAGSCPHCGTDIRKRLTWFIVIGVGILIAAASLFELDSLMVFFILGLLMAAIGGYILYDQRQRLQQAAEQPIGGTTETEETLEQ